MKNLKISTLTRAVCVSLSLLLGACGGGGGGGETAEIQGPASLPGGSSGPSTPSDPSTPPSTPPVDPEIVTVSNASPGNYNLGTLAVGSDVYVDRDFTFTSVPSEFESLVYLQTANDDKFVSAADAVSFDVDGAVTVYVGYDANISSVPSWLQSWTDSGNEIQGSNTVFRIYQKDFSAGRVVLGGNEMGFNMYTVVVTAQGSSGGGGSGGGAAPTIAGTPSSSIAQGVAYSFVPTASDPEGDALTFSISNKPTWASFDTGTGELSGTPGTGDVGDHTGIAISVSDGASTTSLSAFDLTVVGTATGSAVLSWTAPTQNEDGSELTDLAGYTVRYGPSEGNYPNTATINNPGVTTYVVENLTEQTWYFVVTAFDTSRNQSEFSNSASKNVVP